MPRFKDYCYGYRTVYSPLSLQSLTLILVLVVALTADADWGPINTNPNPNETLTLPVKGYLVKLFTKVEVNSGGYLPSSEVPKWQGKCLHHSLTLR